MADEALTVPQEDPPLPSGADQPREQCEGQESLRTWPCFSDIFDEMQLLLQKLRDAHEVETMAAPTPPDRGMVPQSSEPVSRPPEPASPKARATSSRASLLLVDREGETPSEQVRPISTKVSSKLMKEAKQTVVEMEWQIDANSMDSCSLQLREEWDLSEEKLFDLKRIQRRMSASSLASLQKPNIRRQYLVRVKEPGPWFIMSPSSKQRFVWDCIALLAVFYELCVTPLHLYRLENDIRYYADVGHWAMTIFWLLDIPATFLTAVYINDHLRFHVKDIAKAYAKSWLCFDLVMLLPDLIILIFPHLDEGPTHVLRASRVRRMFRLLRFLRLLRFSKIVEKLQSLHGGTGSIRQHSLLWPLVEAALMVLVAAHLLGSFWFALGDTEGGWVLAEGLQDQPLGRQYTRSLEWALSKLPPSSLRTIVELETAAERWLGIFATAATLMSSSLFVSFITNRMAEINRQRVQMRDILQSVRRYCGTHGISYAYTMQIKRYVQREHTRNELQSHMPLLQNLPEGMVRELFQEGRSPILHHHALFKDIGLQDLSMELNLCSQAVSELYLLAGDTIFNTANKIQGMYLLGAGLGIYFYPRPFQSPPKVPEAARPRTVSAQSIADLFGFGLAPALPSRSSSRRPDMAQTMLEAGEYIAEPALWVSGWRYQGHLQAVLESKALLVSTEQFYFVVRDYANVMANTVVYARCFVKELNNSATLCREVTDLPLVSMASQPPARMNQVAPT
ncbi:unnamed protein product [Durusdinium trenchii]|uniref:Ion transport domain-containing protein n=2 Tax=Durusdinium trenchii TaxID=1381693 RepID=A0ABP0SQU3_9DINO